MVAKICEYKFVVFHFFFSREITAADGLGSLSGRDFESSYHGNYSEKTVGKLFFLEFDITQETFPIMYVTLPHGAACFLLIVHFLTIFIE